MNNIHKTLLLLLAIFFTFQDAFSQKSDFKPKQEIGLSLGAQTSFSAIYKKERKDGHYNRIEGAAGGINLNNENLNLNASVKIIKEKRKLKGDRFFFSYGPGVGLSTNIGIANQFSSAAIFIRPTFLYLLGANYKLNDKVYIGAELQPGAGISFNYNSNRNDFNYSANLGASTSARIHIAYRFEG